MIIKITGILVAALGLLLGYLRWRGTAARVTLDCDLVGPSDQPYVPARDAPHYRVQLRNTGRTPISVNEVAVLGTGVGWAFARAGPPVAADLKRVVFGRGCAVGPPLPTTLQPGRAVWWTFPSEMVEAGLIQAQAELGTGRVESVQKAVEPLRNGGFAVFNV